VGQALATEAIAECIRSGGVWETESNMELLDLVSIPAAADWNPSVTVERGESLPAEMSARPDAGSPVRS
jgi:hypothetical protein